MPICLNIFVCEKQCCGKRDHILCGNSCEGYACSSDDDCGGSCCDNGKCVSPNSKACVKKTENEILVLVLFLVGIPVIIVAVIVLYVCCCRRETPAPDMMMIVNTGVNE